jgi:hypothetical protein
MASFKINEFYIKLDNESASFTVFDQISGSFHLNLAEKLLTLGAYLKIVGKQGVFWHENEQEDIEHNEAFTGSNTFLDSRIYFFNLANRSDIIYKASENDEPKKINYVIDENRSEYTLERGEYYFNFNFRIIDLFTSDTKNLPGTFEHEYGEIKYMLVGVLQRPSFDFDYQTVRFLRINSSLLKSEALRNQYFVPHAYEQIRQGDVEGEGEGVVRSTARRFSLSNERRFSLSAVNDSLMSALSTNKLFMRAICEKRAYKPGEIIKLNLKIENEGTTKKIQKLILKLERKLTFAATDPTPQVKTILEEVCSFKQSQFNSNRLNQLDDLALQLPSKLKPASLEESYLIQCKYTLKISLYCSPKFIPGIETLAAQLVIPILIYHNDVEN